MWNCAISGDTFRRAEWKLFIFYGTGDPENIWDGSVARFKFPEFLGPIKKIICMVYCHISKRVGRSLKNKKLPSLDNPVT